MANQWKYFHVTSYIYLLLPGGKVDEGEGKGGVGMATGWGGGEGDSEMERKRKTSSQEIFLDRFLFLHSARRTFTFVRRLLVKKGTTLINSFENKVTGKNGLSEPA